MKINGYRVLYRFVSKSVLIRSISLCVLLFLIYTTPLATQQITQNKTTNDILVLLDTSGTMLPYFNIVNDTLLSEITDAFLRRNDTFHLISFNSKPMLEIVQHISTELDMRAIVSRFRLLYPLGQYSDFVAALKYTQQYVNTLNAESKKILIIITDGIFNPNETSTHLTLTGEEAEQEINSIISRFKTEGIEIFFIKAPFPDGVLVKNTQGVMVAETNAPIPNSTNNSSISNQKIYTDISNVLTDHPAVQSGGIPAAPIISCTENLGVLHYKSNISFTLQNQSDENISLHLSELILSYSGELINILDKSVFIRAKAQSYTEFSASVSFPNDLPDGELLTLSIQPSFADTIRVKPESLSISVILKQGLSFATLLKSTGRTVLIIVCILAGLMLIIITAIFLHTVSSRPHAQAVNRSFTATKESMPLAKPDIIFSHTEQMHPIATSKISSDQLTSDRTSVFTTVATIDSAKAEIKQQKQIHSISEEITYPDSSHKERKEKAKRSPFFLFSFTKANRKEVEKNTDSHIEVKAQHKELVPVLHTKEPVIQKTHTQDTSKAFSKETQPSRPLVVSQTVMNDIQDTTVMPQQIKNQTLAQVSQEKSTTVHASFTQSDSAKEAQKTLSLFGSRRDIESQSILRTKNNIANQQIKPAHAGEKITVTGNTNVMLELFVYNQNTHIGKRNIHLLKPGSRMTLGGGKSDFLVFLVPFPSRIAEIRYDGTHFTLAILKPQYFPYLSNNNITDCLNTNIIVRSDKNYEVTFKLIPYEDPIIKLNKTLLSIYN